MWPLVAIVAIAYAYRGVYDLKKSATVRRLTDRGFGYVDRAWDAADAAAANRARDFAPLDGSAEDLDGYDDADFDDDDDDDNLPPVGITFV